MKLRGCGNKEIAKATGINLKTLQNIVTKGGRLYSTLESLRENKAVILAENNLSVWDSLLAAKDPALQELKRIALESSNDIARLKAVDMIIELTGIRDDDRPPFLDPHNMNDSLEHMAKWINQKVLKTFQEKAPKVIFEFGQDGINKERKMTSVELVRLEEVVKALNRMREELKSNPIHQGEVLED